ncbi:MAG: CBS domain-containing protein, partial [Candidatus Altiarchaeota archaeon]
DALFTMFINQQYTLPVFDEKRFVGTVSISSYAKVLRDFSSRKTESIMVSEIMDEKSTVVLPTNDMKRVLDKLCEKGVYAIAVASGHDFMGIIRRQDLLKKFLPLIKGKFKVMDVMSYHISTNSIHDTVESVAKKIIYGVEKRIIVMNHEKIEGMITIKDLANVLLAEKADLSKMSVMDILTPNTQTVSKHDDAAKAGEIMLEWNTRGVPVVDQHLEGIVRDKDILQRLRLMHL